MIIPYLLNICYYIIRVIRVAKRKVRTEIKVSFFIVLCLLVGISAVFSNSNNKIKNNDKSGEIRSSTTKKVLKRSAKLTLVGDFLFESPFYQSVSNGYNENDYFKFVKDYFLDDDLSIANMEVVIGNETLQVSGDGYNFCAPAYIGSLVSSLDLEVLSTVNNHAYDRGLDGLVSTINYFKNTDIKTVGTYLNEEDRNTPRIIEINGIKFGFLAYTYGTNAKVNETDKRLISVYRDTNTRTINKDLLSKEIGSLKEQADVTIVMMHWGDEFTFSANNEQKEIAAFLNELGVDIIYGSHSHSIQPIEIIGDEKKTLVYYSLGNFVSNDDDIARTPKGQETFDNAYQFGLISTLNVLVDENRNVSFENIKAKPIVNYFDKNMDNWLLIPYEKYTEEYEKNHFRYNLGLTKEFINNTYTSVIEEKYK